jgi:hypothetical protein
MQFNSTYKIRGDFPCDFPTEVIKNEPMFFNSSLEFACKHGGRITRAFIDNLPLDWFIDNPVIDSRVHMLMKNWYPCIPGYHHDDVPRSTPTGQPNYLNPEYESEHLCGLVNSEICPTRFVDDVVNLSEPDVSVLQYEKWHKELEIIAPKTYDAESGKYIQFDCNAFHTGTKAVAGGWRWFIRLSRNTDRQKNITNEIRRQVQVYLENPIEGW